MQDTVKLLRECDAGVKMGVNSMQEVLDYVQDSHFRQLLSNCCDGHIRLEHELQTLLDEHHDDGKDPNPMAKCMSWIKTNVKLAADTSDETIAGLMTDGCNMGVKSLHKYLNQYQAADQASKDITRRLAGLEEQLVTDIRAYL